MPPKETPEFPEAAAEFRVNHRSIAASPHVIDELGIHDELGVDEPATETVDLEKGDEVPRALAEHVWSAFHDRLDAYGEDGRPLHQGRRTGGMTLYGGRM